MIDTMHDGQEHLLNDPDTNAVEQMQQATLSDADHRQHCRRLYISHALSTWNSRLFEFGAFLFLAKIYPNTLLPASVYALARAASAALLSPCLGSYIDNADRLRAVRLSIIWQRLPVVLSCAAFTILLVFPQWTQSAVGKIVPLTLLSVLACIEKLSSVLNTVSVERDWTVVIAGTDEARLATMNAQMRRIDLFCKLAGPLAISSIDSASTRAAVLATAAMTATSVFIEYLAIARVYHAMPALQKSKSPTKLIEHEYDTIAGRVHSNLSVLLSYVQHPAFLPSFALALLYLTVLSFSGQFITYLFTQGLNSATVAALRGLAAIFELSATWLGPWLHARIGAVRAGIWFLNAELVFIALACVALWVPAGTIPSVATTCILLAAVILSRTGLWGFDLSAQLIIQDEVEPAMRGTFSSLEASFQNAFEMLAFLSTVVFPRPADFRFPAAISALAVATAAVLYACFVRDRRGHLLHASKCLDRHQRIKQRQWSYAGIPLQDTQHVEEGHEDGATGLSA